MNFKSCVTELGSSVNFKSCVTELRSCVKVEVDVLDSLSLIVQTVCVDVKQHRRRTRRKPQGLNRGCV